jgi:hypothetical protein
MKSHKLKILSLTLIAILAQGTCTVFAANSKDGYTKDELDNIEPGFEWKDIDKSNYKVDSYINNFSSATTPEEAAKNDKNSSNTSSTTTTATNSTTDSNTGNIIVSTVPSTGRNGDFWGKTKDGKWILIEQGVPVSGWKSVRNKWYYMDADGVMQTGWINDGETWYYLNSDGSMAYNTYVDGYYLNWNGEMQ